VLCIRIKTLLLTCQIYVYELIIDLGKNFLCIWLVAPRWKKIYGFALGCGGGGEGSGGDGHGHGDGGGGGEKRGGGGGRSGAAGGGSWNSWMIL